jgi:hypothetical protein
MKIPNISAGRRDGGVVSHKLMETLAFRRKIEWQQEYFYFVAVSVIAALVIVLLSSSHRPF